MSDGAQEENRRREYETELRQINRHLARLIVLMEALLRDRRVAIPPEDSGPIVRFAKEEDDDGR